jgi:rRNA maturation protein Nop10
MRCAHCGAESQPETLSFCPVCGAKRARRWQQEIRCPACGRYAASSLRVCPSCGATLNAKPSGWGLALLCLLAAATIVYGVQRYDLGKGTFSAIRRAPSAAISRLADWRDRLFSVVSEEDVLPTPASNRVP